MIADAVTTPPASSNSPTAMFHDFREQSSVRPTTIDVRELIYLNNSGSSGTATNFGDYKAASFNTSPVIYVIDRRTSLPLPANFKPGIKIVNGRVHPLRRHHHRQRQSRLYPRRFQHRYFAAIQ